MPMQPVTLHRWQIAAAFVVLTVVFTVSIALSTGASHSAARSARKADRVSSRNTGLIHQIVENRKQTIAKLHAQDVRSCRRVHRLVKVFRRTLGGSIRDSRRFLAGPLGRGPTAAAIRNGITRSQELLDDLRSADCAHVPHLGPIKPKKVPTK